ncbi:MAG: EAL domain-containing protein [Spongiibacteraceae bacterium]
MTFPIDYITALESDDDQRRLYSRLKAAAIMIVDDQPELMRVVERYLLAEGYCHVHKSTQLSALIEQIRQHDPDLLLLCLNTGSGSGGVEADSFGLLRAIRADTQVRFLPVIVLLPEASSADKLTALELGAADFISEPIDASELSVRVRNSLMIKAYQDQLAYYDSLTRLPNRKFFIDRVDRAITPVGKDQQSVKVLLIAIDRFKQINDSFGFSTGDVLLQMIATRLMNMLRHSNIVIGSGEHDITRQLARTGGDEFSMLLLGGAGAIVDQLAVKSIATQLLAGLREPYYIDDVEVLITASIGVAEYVENSIDTDTLLKEADAACAYIKALGGDGFKTYSPEINALSRQRAGMEVGLRRALERQELIVHYQPKIDLATGAVFGMEALLRWPLAGGGFVSPEQFIPVAEATGLIVPLGEWVLYEACKQHVAWQQQGLTGLKISVNVSGYQFRKSGFATLIKRTLVATGMLPQDLIVELTESTLTGDIDGHIRILESIKAMGAGLSIDDFGTGYSSLSYLNRLPISELKIDRSFIINVPTNTDDSVIVKAIIAMSHSLQLTVVAEGVETRAQLDYLQQQGCDIIQGDWFSPPMAAGDFFEFVKLTNKKARVTR